MKKKCSTCRLYKNLAQFNLTGRKYETMWKTQYKKKREREREREEKAAV
jgi:hypothetical protein